MKKALSLTALLLASCILFASCSILGEKILICSSCGAENSYLASYCKDCGTLIQKKENTPSGIGGNNGNGQNNGTSNNNSEPKTWLLLTENIKSTGVTINYYYDGNGYLVGEESIRSDSTMASCTFYTNDSHGNPIEEYLPLLDQMGFDATHTIKNTYDAKGRLTKAYNEDYASYDQYHYEGNELVKVSHVKEDGTEYYEQYENGRLVRAYKKDGTTSWTPVTIEYYYDKKGNCTGTNYYTHFEMDEYGNILADDYATYEYITLDDYLRQNLHDNDYVKNENDNSSGGNNNGGGNNNNTNKGTACLHCKQSGRIECTACDGTGKVFSRFDEKGNKVMKTCMRAGCSGGKVKCYYCGGDGIFGN